MVIASPFTASSYGETILLFPNLPLRMKNLQQWTLFSKAQKIVLRNDCEFLRRILPKMSKLLKNCICVTSRTSEKDCSLAFIKLECTQENLQDKNSQTMQYFFMCKKELAPKYRSAASHLMLFCNCRAKKTIFILIHHFVKETD